MGGYLRALNNSEGTVVVIADKPINIIEEDYVL